MGAYTCEHIYCVLAHMYVPWKTVWGLHLSITTWFVETGPLTKAGTRLLVRTRALPVPIPPVPLVTDPCLIGARVPNSGTHAVL